MTSSDHVTCSCSTSPDFAAACRRSFAKWFIPAKEKDYTALLGSDGQGPQGLSFDFLDFFLLLICLIFYPFFFFGSLTSSASGATSRAPSSRASVGNISFEIELNV
jgi:hypothetical protein